MGMARRDMDWQEELIEVLELADAKELAAVLMSKLGEVARPSEEGYHNIGIALERLAQIVAEGRDDINTALWMAFWLGAAWQKACHDAEEG